VALPYLRYSAGFEAHKKGVALGEGVSELHEVRVQRGPVRQSGVRFRVCEFFAGGWSASFQDVLPLH
jgi:hypothetical protein